MRIKIGHSLARIGMIHGGLSIVLLGGLAACSMPLSYVARNQPGTAEVQQFQDRRLEAQDLKTFLIQQGRKVPAENEAWELDTLALGAGYFSPDFKAAEAHWRSTLELSSGARVTPVVQRLDTLLDHHSTTDASRSSPWTLGLGFELVLPDADRKAAKVALADEEMGIAKIRMASVLWQEYTNLIRAFLQFESAKKERELYLEREALMKERVDRLQVRMNAGLESPAFLREAQLSLEKAAKDRQAREQRVAEAARAVKASLHLPGTQHVPKIKDDLSHRFDHLANMSRTELETRALLNRLDVAEAEAGFRWSDARLKLAIAEQYPEISLSPGYEWDQNDHRIRLGVGLPLNLPIMNRAQVRALQETREEAAAKLLGQQEAVLQEIYQGSVSYKEARDRVQATASLLNHLEIEVRRVERAVSMGDEDALALTDTRLQENELKIQLESLRSELMMIGWHLEVALAEPSTELMKSGH